MRHRWLDELKLVEAMYGAVEVGPDSSWFIIPTWKLCSGWNKRETALLLLRPPGYPVTPPDNFFVDPDLRLNGDVKPGNTDPDTQAGRPWLRFSYHIEPSDWSPDADITRGHNLTTFLQGVRNRLEDLS
jgi:Prokaryotic E2 family E